ncbi:potassium channel family protein [Streptomyces sp. NPDC005805]|uniref:potassium channel family protein n=1 Tax=Streptomyces sp. NPDC005805 TaxID=3157068 RepID=UPI0033EA3951
MTGKGKDPHPAARKPHRSGRGLALRWALSLTVVAAMTTGYFLFPLEHFGPDRPVLSWTLFIAALGSVALLLLLQIRDVILENDRARPGIAIPLLMCLSVVVFSGAYHTLARTGGEFHGLETRLDALYFTIITLATVGYGDIVPTGQTARVVTIVQILYTFVFLTAATTTLSRRVRRQVGRRLGHQPPADDS